MKLPSRKAALLAVLAGALQACSMAWPAALPALPVLGVRAGASVWWLQLACLTVLSTLLLQWQQDRELAPTQRRQLGAAGGFLFGASSMATGVSWTYVSLHTYGGLAAPLAGLAVAALSTLLAAFYSLACWGFMALAPVRRAWEAIIFAALWMLAELARGTWLTGFAWAATGYAHTDGPLAAYAPWVGVYGMGAAAALAAMACAQWLTLRRRSATTLLTLASVFGGAALLPTAHTASTGHIDITVLQGNIPQDEKFEPGSGVPLALRWYAQALQDQSSGLVIAPETAIPLLPQQLPDGYWEPLARHYAQGPRAALVGIPLGNFQAGYTNSVLGLQPGQTQPWRYDKRHLVPFGEFIPPWFKWFTALLHIPLGDFNRGAATQTPFVWQGQRIAANICYEDLFGEELALQFHETQQSPTVMVNLSNLGWFGPGLALDQHLQIARLRALELQRPFVLATNTGISATIDHHGAITQAWPRGVRSVLHGQVEGRTGVTPYAAWVARCGLWPLWLVALGVLTSAALRLRARDLRP